MKPATNEEFPMTRFVSLLFLPVMAMKYNKTPGTKMPSSKDIDEGFEAEFEGSKVHVHNSLIKVFQ